MMWHGKMNILGSNINIITRHLGNLAQVPRLQINFFFIIYKWYKVVGQGEWVRSP